ncbi:major facilitator superfamily domain-containing protein [Sporodiniella umbellata]|nr:major facilitator superfamily domain-containing protein [Sporodiniella umbellata]
MLSIRTGIFLLYLAIIYTKSKGCIPNSVITHLDIDLLFIATPELMIVIFDGHCFHPLCFSPGPNYKSIFASKIRDKKTRQIPAYFIYEYSNKNGFNGEKSNQEVVFDDLKNSNLERISIKSVSIDSTVDRDSLKGALIKSESEKKLVWKINYTLLPFIGAIIFIQFLIPNFYFFFFASKFIDKFTLSVAAILGLINDTSLTGTQYSWLGSFFYLGFVCFQIPSNYLLQKFKISRYLGVLLIMWGIVMCCTALCKNFTQLAVTRVLLGLFEAGTYPSLIIIINTIYRRSEQSAAYGYLWLSNGTGTMIGSACAYGISYINNAKGISSWKWPYIIWGSLTILFGIICFFFLPDNPYSFMFRLTEEEEKIVQKRTQDNAVVRVYEIKKWHIWEALREPRLWLICFAAFFNNLHTSGLVIFSTLIVQGLGFSASNTILMLIPGGFMAALFCILAAYISRKTGQLYPGAAVCTTISLVGVVLLAVLPMAGIKLLGYFLAWGARELL